MDSGDRSERQAAVFFFDQHRDRGGMARDFFHGHRAGAGTATAVRRGKCFVQIEVHHVDAEIAGAGDAG